MRKVLKFSLNHIYVYISNDIHAYSNRLRECPVKIRQTFPFSMTTQKISSRSDNHASIMSHSGGETHNTTSHNYHEPTTSHIENLPTQCNPFNNSNTGIY